METRPEYVKSPPEIANFLDVALGSMGSLIDAGIVVEARNRWGTAIKGKWDLLASNVGYIRFLRTRKATKDEATQEFERARNQRMAATAEEAVLKLAALKAELHTVDAVLAVVEPQHIAFRQRMLAIPNKTARRLAAETDHVKVQRILTGEVKEALNELRGFSPKVSHRNGAAAGSEKRKERRRKRGRKAKVQ